MSNSIVRDAFDGSVASSPRELVDQPRVDRPEHRPPLARSAQPVDVAQQPLDLRAREVRVEHQPGALADERLVALRRAARRSAPRCGGPATRSRGAAARRSRGSHTHTVSRWLVMPTASSSPGSTPGVVERLARDRVRDLPDLARVVLDPARAAGSAARTRGRRARSARPRSSNTRQVVPVVPWSIARITPGRQRSGTGPPAVRRGCPSRRTMRQQLTSDRPGALRPADLRSCRWSTSL